MGCGVSINQRRDDDPGYANGKKQVAKKGLPPLNQSVPGEKKNVEPFVADCSPSAPAPLPATLDSTPSTPGSTDNSTTFTTAPGPKRFKLRELEKATNYFDDSCLLGEGSFGRVYRGELSGKKGTKAIAIKKLKVENGEGMDDWLAEVLMLGTLHHPNLVSLIGYCAGSDDALLTYELCPKGSLEDHLFPPNPSSNPAVLSWRQRVLIAQGAARGLAYLHENNVIHRDLKPSNILLSEDMAPKLSDFGMARASKEGETHVSTRIMGTLGYLDPTYLDTGHLRVKSDVYAFGIILFELITGKHALSDDGEMIVSWVLPLLSQRKPDLELLMDPRLNGQYPKAGAVKLAIIAKHCTYDEQDRRPDMAILTENLDLVDLEKAVAPTPPRTPPPAV